MAIVTSQAFSLVNFRGPLIHALISRGVTVYAFAPDYDFKTLERVRQLGAIPVSFEMSRTGLNPLQDIISLISLTRRLKEARPDAILAYFIKPVVYGMLAGRLSRVNMRFALLPGLGSAFVQSETETFRRRAMRLFATALYRISLHHATTAIFQNEADRSEFVSRGIISLDRTELVRGTGVDLSEWEYSAPHITPVTFVLAARLLKEKGVGQFVASARKIRLSHPETRFIVLGSTDPNPDSFTPDEVTSWVEEGVIEWPGHVDVRPLLRQASVFVLPSYYREGVPRSVQEAMAMGRPIITTDTPGCRDTVIDGLNGFLVPPKDVDALTNRMLQFILEPELIGSMGSESRKLAEERFDVHKLNQQMLATMGIHGPGVQDDG